MKNELEKLINILIFFGFFTMIICVLYMRVCDYKIHDKTICNVALIVYSIFLILFVLSNKHKK